VFWDILIAVGIGLTQLAITWYAVDISVKEKRIQNAVIIGVVGLIGIDLTVFATVRNGLVQRDLEVRLYKIQKNTETPPQVTVNPAQVNLTPNIQVMPRPELRHTHVQFANPFQVPQPDTPTLPLQEGKPSGINIGVYNSGDYIAKDCKMGASLTIEKTPIDEAKIFENFLRNARMGDCQDLMPRSGTNYQYTFHTYVTPPFTSDDLIANRAR